MVLDRLLQSFTFREIFLQEYVCENYKWWKGNSIYDFNSVVKLSNYSDETSELIQSKAKYLLKSGRRTPKKIKLGNDSFQRDNIIELNKIITIDDAIKSKSKSMIKITKKTGKY